MLFKKPEKNSQVELPDGGIIKLSVPQLHESGLLFKKVGREEIENKDNVEIYHLINEQYIIAWENIIDADTEKPLEFNDENRKALYNYIMLEKDLKSDFQNKVNDCLGGLKRI